MSVPGDIVPFPIKGPTKPATIMGIKGDFLAKFFHKTRRYYEGDLLSAIHKYGRGGTHVDVGAHYGNHTVYFLLEGGAERVVAFEPNPKNFKVLQATVAANNLEPLVELHNVGVHDQWTSAKLEGRPGNTGNFMLVEEGGSCPLVRLDDVLLDGPPVSVIKIDVEGAEGSVLRSGMGTIRRDKPLITVECRTGSGFVGLKEQAASILAPLGYEIEGCYCSTPTYLFCAT